MKKDDNEKSEDVIISPNKGRIKITSYAPTVWITASFARVWFDDAISESRKPSKDRRRREIIFSVAFAESYLFEWVRDSILNSDYDKLNLYFIPGDHLPVKEKWIKIPKKLKQNGFLLDVPDLGRQYWSDWKTLVDYRNGLIHARASRPFTSSLPEDEKPVPDGVTLSEIEPGWAIGVTINMIMEFHQAACIDPPDWLSIDA